MNTCTLSLAFIDCPQYGIWESYVQYGKAVFRYRYSDMMSYDNAIFNISASIFSILVFRFRVSEPFWVKSSCKT